MSASSKKRSKVQMLQNLPAMQNFAIGSISSKSPNKKLSVIELQKKIKKVQVPQLNLGKILGKQNSNNYKSQFLVKPPSFSAQSGAIICTQDVQIIQQKNMKNNQPFGNSQSAQLSARKFDSQITQDQYPSRNNFFALKVQDPKQSSLVECSSGAYTIFNLPFSPITAIKKQEIMQKQPEDKENISSAINQDQSNKTRRQQSEPSRKTYDETEVKNDKVNLKIKVIDTLHNEGENQIIKNSNKNVTQITEKQNNIIEVNHNKKEQTEKTIRGRNPKFFYTERMLLENCQLASASSQLQLKATKLLSGQLLSLVQSSQNLKQSALPQKKQSKPAIMSDPATRSCEREPSKSKETRLQSKDSALGRFRRGIQENNSANYKIQNYHLAERSESNKNQKGGSAKPEENPRKVKNVSALPIQKQKVKMSQLNFIMQGPQGTMTVDFKGKPLTLAPSSLPLKTERIQKDVNQNNLYQNFTVDTVIRNQEESDQLNNHFQTNIDPSFLEIANKKIRQKDHISEDHFTQGSLLNQIISPNSEEYEQQEKKSSEERNIQQTMKSKNTRTSFQNLISIFKQASSLMKPKAKSARPCQKKQKKEANCFKPSETAPPCFQDVIKTEPNLKIVNIQTCKIDKAITGSQLQLELGLTSNQISEKFQELSEIGQIVESRNLNNIDAPEKRKIPSTIQNSHKKKKETLRQSSKKRKDSIQQSANKNKDKAIKLFHESKPKQKDETIEQDHQQDSAVQAYGISMKQKNQQTSITKKRSLALLDLSNDLVQLNKEILQQKLTNFSKNSFGSSGCATTTAKQTNGLNAIFSSRQLKKSFQPNEYQPNKKQQSSNSSKAAEIDSQQIDKNGITPRTVNINVIHKQSPKQKVIKIRKDQLILKK